MGKINEIYVLKNDHILYGKSGFKINGVQYSTLPDNHKQLFVHYKEYINHIMNGNNHLIIDPIPVAVHIDEIIAELQNF